MAGRGERSDKINELFKWGPVSYRVDRRSALKMELRRALSEKLVEFLGNFADETLVEYVIVLLCNGKDQYQAHEGLVDFLGEDTNSFVAWLWDYLSRKGDGTEKSGHTASNCKRMEVQRPSNEVQAQAVNASLDNEGPGRQSKHYAGSRVPSDNLVLSSRSSQKEIHEASLRLEEDLHGSVSSRRSLQKKLRASITEERMEDEHPISSPRGVSSLAAAGAPDSPCPDESQHYKRGEKPHSSTRSSRSFHMHRSEVVAIGRNIDSSNREILGIEHSKKLPILAVDKMDNELKPVQRNVWDRLGKPHNETNNPFLKERNNSFLPVPAATVPPIHPLVTQNLPSAQAHFVSTSLYPEGVFRTTSLCTPMRANGEIVNKLKRQFEQIESHLRASTVSSKSAERVPAKQRLGISLGPPQPLPVGNCFSSNMANEPVLVHTGLKPDMVSNAGSLNSDQRAPITPTEDKALENSETGKSSQESPSKVSDMKVKLEETENDMQDLSKQAQFENLKPNPETYASSGAQPSQMEDMDSRTVLVTNVHFGATKEAIVSHFAKCGPVTKVIMLRDTITGKPKGAACVIFTQKNSVEKAISLSGTSLLSRILKVMLKADAPSGLLEKPHQVWKHTHSLQLPPPSWNSPHCYPMTTHLRWRRETNPSVSK